MTGPLPLSRSLQVTLRAAATAWLRDEPDAANRDELARILEIAGQAGAEGETIADTDASARAEAWRELRDRFGRSLRFGTAGLRGRQAAGPNRMNRIVVARAAAGFAAFLLARASQGHPDSPPPGAPHAGKGSAGEGSAGEGGDPRGIVAAAPRADASAPTIVIGYDARRNSERYARDTAEIMEAAGVEATLLPRALPTPVLAFAVRHLGASAGVMVTASHNPRPDNGYKVYLGGVDQGSQIVPPSDAEIAEEIDRVASTVRYADIPRSEAYATADESLVDAYVAAAASVHRAAQDAPPVPFAYTPIHGVGLETFFAVLDRIGLPHPVVVAEQAAPDGAFPTTPFPNPEEQGTLDLLFATAERAGVRLALANDPDADRLAVAERQSDGTWRRFGGNEIGQLLGWRAAERAESAGRAGALAVSLVSSPALRRVAEAYDLDYAETQTGFKWISRAPRLLYGYEEALGYLVNPDDVRDKDGISAAVAVLELAAREAAAGRTLGDLERRFRERFGAFASEQVALRYAHPDSVGRVMVRLRTAVEAGALLDGATVHDLRSDSGGASDSSGEHAGRAVDAAAAGDAAAGPDIVRIDFGDGTRAMIRPSGTEPKLKIYLDAVSDEGSAQERAATAQHRVDTTGRRLRILVSELAPDEPLE